MQWPASVGMLLSSKTLRHRTIHGDGGSRRSSRRHPPQKLYSCLFHRTCISYLAPFKSRHAFKKWSAPGTTIKRNQRLIARCRGAEGGENVNRNHPHMRAHTHTHTDSGQGQINVGCVLLCLIHFRLIEVLKQTHISLHGHRAETIDDTFIQTESDKSDRSDLSLLPLPFRIKISIFFLFHFVHSSSLPWLAPSTSVSPLSFDCFSHFVVIFSAFFFFRREKTYYFGLLCCWLFLFRLHRLLTDTPLWIWRIMKKKQPKETHAHTRRWNGVVVGISGFGTYVYVVCVPCIILIRQLINALSYQC